MPRTLSAGVVIRPASQLPAGAREIQKRRRIVVPGADNEGDLIFFLKVVEFFGELQKTRRASKQCLCRAKDSRLCTCWRAASGLFQRHKELGFQKGSVFPFAGSSLGMT